MPREIGIFNSMKPCEPYLQYLTNPKLLEWYNNMKEDFDDPVVKCDSCGKDFKNNPNARFIQDESKFYACSGDCKAKLAGRVRKQKKDQDKKDAISQMLSTATINQQNKSNAGAKGTSKKADEKEAVEGWIAAQKNPEEFK